MIALRQGSTENWYLFEANERKQDLLGLSLDCPLVVIILLLPPSLLFLSLSFSTICLPFSQGACLSCVARCNLFISHYHASLWFPYTHFLHFANFIMIMKIIFCIDDSSHNLNYVYHFLQYHHY